MTVRMIRVLGMVCPGLLGLALALPAHAAATDFTVTSPDGEIVATVTYAEGPGTLSYRVRSGRQEIIDPSPIGIHTSIADFRSGMALAGTSRRTIDDRYTLPQGKVSSYHDRANELVVRLTRDGRELHVRFRAYDDGVAYSFAIPGTGPIEFRGESSAVAPSGRRFSFYGQNHPNNYGYESSLGPVYGERISNPVLARLHDRDYWLLIGQAATYGNYVQTHLRRVDNTFHYSYPLDQDSIGPVTSTLPFQSPWRMVIVSPGSLEGIVESYLVENLNPPTDPRLLNADGTTRDWIRGGRVMWDFIAGDRDKPRQWVDAAAEMGWEYYMADAGFQNRFGGPEGVQAAVGYARSKGVGVLGWAHTREFDTEAKAIETMRRYADWGLKGAKIDFFDHNTLSDHPRDWRDYEDTQRSLRMRDWIFEQGIQNDFLLELHGNTIPTGERRRYPNLMTLEGVNGMERRQPNIRNDLTVPYIRNVMGPVSYTVIRMGRSPGSHAYQLAMPIVYEAGLMIYAEHGDTLLRWPGRELIADLPASWDETRFIEGLPGEHVVIARRRGDSWWIGGMTDQARTVDLELDFLAPGTEYDLLLFGDETHTSMRRETRRADRATELSVALHEKGGFALRLRPVGATPRE